MKKGFTLAETLIVLVILGIIASITIPALVRRHVESSNKNRIRKAMSVYDTALNKMVIENGIKSNDALINEFNAEKNNNSCAKSRAYFKSAQDGANDCTFRASDGVWWNISNINNPIIAFNEDDLTDEIASGDTNKAFRLVGYLDNNGSLRVGDLAVAEGTNKEYLTKLYNFINKTSLESQVIVKSAYDKWKDGYYNTICSSWDKTNSCIWPDYRGAYMYDENGKELGMFLSYSYSSNHDDEVFIEYVRDDSGDIKNIIIYNGDVNGQTTIDVPFSNLNIKPSNSYGSTPVSCNVNYCKKDEISG